MVFSELETSIAKLNYTPQKLYLDCTVHISTVVTIADCKNSPNLSWNSMFADVSLSYH